MQEQVFNVYHIVKFIEMLLIIFGGFFIISILINTIKDMFAKNKDSKITTDLIDKFPAVPPSFFAKSWKEQTAENNQEIHEVNVRLDKNDREIEEIWQVLKRLTNIVENKVEKE